MSFCHECGEQVANEDVFCPFCGITLKPVAPADDISASETIVGAPESSASPIPDAPAPTFEPPTFEPPTFEPPPPMPPLEDIPAPRVEPPPPISNPFGQPSAPLPPPDFNVTPPPPSPFTAEPLPAVAETVEEAAPEAEPEPSVPAPPPVFEPPVFTPPVAAFEPPVFEPEPVAAKDAEPETFAAPEVFAAPEIEAVPEIEPMPETDPVPAIAPVPAPEFFADVDAAPDIPAPAPELAPEEPVFAEPEPDIAPEPAAVVEAPVAEFDAPAPPPPVEQAPFEPPVFAPPVFSPDAPLEFDDVKAEPAAEEAPVAEEPAPVVTPIAMPEKALLLEPEEPATRYDSVQIIEKQIAEGATLKPGSPNSGDVAASEGRSFTTPNMGGSDTDGRKSAKLKPLDEGTILNSRYEIVRKIGGGGMGAVYLANDRNLGGVLRAVKEMVQSYIESEQQEKAVNDFKRESLLLTSLDHPAIPTIYDYFFDEKEARFYLVMKYISGGDLAGRLRAAPEGKIEEKSVVEWAIQVADVLHYLHNHEPSIVYRDLKPANVMIDGNSGRVMLIDFGIARWVNKEEKGVTAVGTMGYAPPELFSGNVEPRSDIYSLGSTMFHLLTGADPQSNPLLIFDFQKNPRPRQINSRLTDQIEQILMRSVEYNAELRFASAGEMRDALKDHLANLNAGRVTYGVKAAPANLAFSEQYVFCGFCGKQIVATDVFCAFCGAQQPIAQQGAAPSAAIQPVTAKLTVIATGELEPSTFRIEKNDNLLGRRDPMSNIFPEVDLSKFDPQTKISRRHARVWRDGNSFLVEDLGSSNGTTLLAAGADAVRLLPHQPRSLTNGDRIKLGDTLLQFTVN